MKKLLILLFSLFFLSSPSVIADDISDFQIEGISIGDSLLDYMTEEEILKEIEKTKNHYYYLNEPNKYVEVYLWKDFPIYKDGVSFFLQNNQSSKYVTNKNEAYTILSVRGLIDFTNDFDSCILKKEEISRELIRLFVNAKKTEFDTPHPIDPSGNSKTTGVSYLFDSGDKAQLYCIDFEEKFRINNNYGEGLSVVIRREEIRLWLNDY